MVRKKFTIIAYDITRDNKRVKVAALLEQYGTRRNKSVFECMVTESQLKRITTGITKLINPKTDTVLIYRVCLSCYLQSETIGRQTPFAGDTVLMV
jgi:CRISPR-associated protein Cas2